jgi:hypothetical protein
LADDAVGCQPVSKPNSLLTGNFTGNFAKSWLLERRRRQTVESAQGVSGEFPTSRNRELFQPEQGILAQEQGISLGETEIIAG